MRDPCDAGRLLSRHCFNVRRCERVRADPGDGWSDEPHHVLRHIQHGPLTGPETEEEAAMSAQLKDHVVLVTGALGTLGAAMCEAIEAAGGTAIRSDMASRGKVDIPL